MGGSAVFSSHVKGTNALSMPAASPIVACSHPYPRVCSAAPGAAGEEAETLLSAHTHEQSSHGELSVLRHAYKLEWEENLKTGREKRSLETILPALCFLPALPERAGLGVLVSGAWKRADCMWSTEMAGERKSETEQKRGEQNGRRVKGKNEEQRKRKEGRREGRGRKEGVRSGCEDTQRDRKEGGRRGDKQGERRKSRDRKGGKN